MALRLRIFYIILVWLVLLDSFLLSRPNLLGKIGLIIYKYHYLRSFPRTLLTVSGVIIVGLIICWIVEYMVKQQRISKVKGLVYLSICVAASMAIFIKTIFDFTAWSYRNTGWKFKYGAYFLPLLLILVFIFYIVEIKKLGLPEPVDETEPNNEQPKIDL